jgi:cellulose synthase operon protein B
MTRSLLLTGCLLLLTAWPQGWAAPSTRASTLQVAASSPASKVTAAASLPASAPATASAFQAPIFTPLPELLASTQAAQKNLLDNAALAGIELSSLPLRKARLTFNDLGMATPVTLRGTESSMDVGLSVRLDELVESATLHLIFTLSPSLLPELSHLQILLNDEVLQTVQLDRDRLGSPQAVDLPIDPRYFTDFNRVSFKFIGHYTLDCEFPQHTSLWAAIGNDSSIELNLRHLPLKNDLALLPAPFFDPRDNRPVKVTLVTGRQPSLGQLKAAGSLAGWFGVLSAYRGTRFQVLNDNLPVDRHAIVIATNQDRPAFLKSAPAVQQPTLSVMDNPQAPTYKLLVLQGKDDAQVEMAAQALALGRAALSGASLSVNTLQLPPPRKPYDAPRWLATDNPVPLGKLVDHEGQLQLRGPVLNDVIRINTRMAPDLFAWNGQGVPLNLYYRYTPTAVSDRGSVDLAINDQFVRSYSLKASSDDASGVSNMILPLVDAGDYQARSDFRIPAFLLGGDNQLQLAFKIPPSDFGKCQSSPSPELRAAVDPQSSIDLTGFYHYIAMPNLVAYANSGYPFTRLADLSETTVVLPDQPTPGDVALYLTAISRMGVATGYPGTRFRLLPASRAQEAGDTDLLVVSHAGADALLRGWGQHLPALIEAGKRSIRPLDRAITGLSDLFNLTNETPPLAASGSAIFEGTGALGAIAGFESPLESRRTVISLTATDALGQQLINDALNDAGQVRQIRGDLSLLRANAQESFRVNPVYYVGDLPWWRRVWFYLHNHPILLAVVGLSTGLFLAFLAYLALRLRARLRLGAT